MTKEQEARARELEYVLEHAGADTLREIILGEYVKVQSTNMREAIKEEIIRIINAE